ncbi:BTAD domain-containing putative transcriptional regulator [Streptomyces sp. NPDC127039]|uniref:AfsR/SARP family transcriptional regulator n=1 Tax=Streptomyces sp. NPDC127039 TaxID=3347115 RepID=UPI0036521414
MLRKLLGLLVLKAPQPATYREIVDVLWPSGPPESSRSLVHTYVSQVRQLLEPQRILDDTGNAHSSRGGNNKSSMGSGENAAHSVERVPGGYRLRAEANQTDLGRFQDLVARARRTHDVGDLEIAHQSLALALQCWRGPVLSDVDPLFEQHPSAVLATEQRVEAALRYADASLTLGRPEQAVPVLWELSSSEPLHEGVHARLVLTLAGCGEQAAALRAYGTFRQRLDDQLGITPGRELQEAHLRVLRQQIPRPRRTHPGGATSAAGPAATGPASTGPLAFGQTAATGPDFIGQAAFAEADFGQAGFDRTAPAQAASSQTAPVHAKPSQLPAGTSAYVGRERQLRELDALLGVEPAVHGTVMTVVGPPGVGKTALALEWAQAHRDHFEDGQLFVDLRGHSPLPELGPADVLGRFLRALGVPPDGVPTGEEEAAALYRTLLAGRRMLVVLDNAGSVDQVRPLLPGGSRCHVLITGRSQLAGLVATEGARRLGLDVLHAFEAQALLGRILGETRTAAEPDAVVRLAQLCGGLPLALRIAAANLMANPTLSIARYCTELAGGSLIGGLQVEGDERSTVRAAFDLSYLALPEPARRAFRLLSFVPGSDVTDEGATALIGAPAAQASRLLRRLAHSHLVQEPTPGRFGLHDLLRSYARELAGDEEPQAVLRLLDWYLTRTEDAAELLYPDGLLHTCEPPRPAAVRHGPADAAQATEWLTAERDNLVSTVRYAVDNGHHAVARRLAQALHGFLSLGMHTADRLAVARAGLVAAVADGEPRAESAARLRLADCHWGRGHNADAEREYAHALAVAEACGWRQGQAVALRRIGRAHLENGAMAKASLCLSRARDLTPRNAGPGAAEDLMNLGLICWKLGRLHEAVDHYTQAARLRDELSSPGGAAIVRTNLGVVHRAMGRPALAIEMLDRALAIHAEGGNMASRTVALSSLSVAHSDMGDHVRGLRLAQDAIASAQALQDPRLEANAWLAMGAAQERAGEGAAADSYRVTLQLAERVNDRFPHATALIALATLAARHDAPEEALAIAGQALEQAREAEFQVLEASSLHALALARLRLGDTDEAIEVAGLALAMHRQTGHRPGEARSLVILAGGYGARGRPDLAFGHRRQALLLFREMGIAGYRDFAIGRTGPRGRGAAGGRR